ncbi:TetR/AcrR family transcriptional regulator, acrAB operon repressor [Glaciecola punicea ACAM 611]|jgi:TetR/AcrR family acrAB operon transcriptional repressor|uniref:TetR/AcrR family transcriptional regulator, acrAB operon repressor n=1 Tax=Glaciecola punicea ACAM 611 TaxID=1121923 RepID=H5TCD3_9ALTE|nr:TetR family transcriptional regulator [Glaciecola punicea]OFA31936.1 TetR family transcriptional regulator [Glaciecola punicea]GAB55960.1 TetR/AcrR family transcriptional regulator, acrAB operon repressor [Glaciecola punicea ACAM 611]
MRRTKADSEITKQAILDAAIEVFDEYGVAKSSLEKIAQRASVTRGAVYWHFENKQQIFDALHECLHAPFIQAILEGLTHASNDPIGQLQHLCVSLLVDLQRDEKKRKLVTLFLIKCDYSGEFAHSRERYNEAKKQKVAALSQYFERAIEKGQLSSSADPKMLTLAISAFLRGIVEEYLEAPHTYPIEERAPALMAIFFGNAYLRTPCT